MSRRIQPSVWYDFNVRVFERSGVPREITTEHKLLVNYQTLRKLVRREFGAKLKVPRPVHEKKTPSAPRPFPRS